MTDDEARFTLDAEADLLRLYDFLLSVDVGAAERAQWRVELPITNQLFYRS